MASYQNQKMRALIFFLCFGFMARGQNISSWQITRSNSIEVSTPACHAATLEEVSPGHLVSAWFGGQYEGSNDVGIYLAHFKNNGWSIPQRILSPHIIQQDTLPLWNPVLFKSAQGILYLFYKYGKNPREWLGAFITSNDLGESWSQPQNLPDGFLGPIRNKPLEVSPGIILFGSSTESIENDLWRVHLERFNEKNSYWEKISVPNPKNLDVIQPTFLSHGGNKIQILCRSRHNRVISSWSSDRGKTWGPLDSLQLIHSNSGIDAETISKTDFLLVNNPLLKGEEWYVGRNVLSVEYSMDGLQWKTILDLENEPKGEFSYPAIKKTLDGKVHILYTFNRRKIKHVELERH